MNVKFVRGLVANIPTGNGVPGSLLFHAKLLYEFWGFCVHGSNDLRTPSGFATLSGTLAPNYINMPANFESGSSVLLASGSDGSTAYGNSIFTAPSVNWTSGSMVGKYLVTWKSGSTSTDDSVYPITQVISSSSIKVDVTIGGTPMSQSLNELAFSERSDINFRVVDISAASQLPGYTQLTNHMMLQFNASDVNAGQANSQLWLRLGNGGLTYSQFYLNASPSGSWNGTTFSPYDLGPTVFSETWGSSEDQFLRNYDFVTTAGGIHQISIFADKAGIILHRNVPGQEALTPGTPSYFHAEVPKRLYPQDKDPNPVAYMCVGRKGVSTNIGYQPASEQGNYPYGWQVPNFAEVPTTTSRKYNAIIKRITGTNVGAAVSATSDTIVMTDIYSGNGQSMAQLLSSRDLQAFYNRFNNSFLIQEILLAQTKSSTNFSLGRVKLRLARFLNGQFQIHTKMGNAGQWIVVKEGILWPWDNAQLDRQLFLYGA
jgi:hypothetical protein